MKNELIHLLTSIGIIIGFYCFTSKQADRKIEEIITQEYRLPTSVGKSDFGDMNDWILLLPGKKDKIINCALNNLELIYNHQPGGWVFSALLEFTRNYSPKREKEVKKSIYNFLLLKKDSQLLYEIGDIFGYSDFKNKAIELGYIPKK